MCGVSGCVFPCGVLFVFLDLINLKMDMFSLEEDDARDLFLTQESNVEARHEDNVIKVPQYEDISDDDDSLKDFQLPEKPNFRSV